MSRSFTADRTLQASVSTLGALKVIYTAWDEAPFYVRLEQYHENGDDAGGKDNRYFFEQNRILYVDDGTGMGLFMLPQDEALLRRAEETGDLALLDALRDSASLRTLQWMVEHFTFSAKKLLGKEPGRGTKGFGSVAANGFATITYRTRPRIDLARALLGPNTKESDYGFYELTLPTLAQVQKGETYCLPKTVIGKQLLDPDNRPMSHGTVVELTLTSPIYDRLSPTQFAAYLKRHFGPDIAKGRYKLTVIDKVSDDARKNFSREQRIEVQPVTYKGIPILDTSFRVGEGRQDCGVALYFNLQGEKDGGVTIRRQERGTCSLKEIPAFSGNEAVWGRPELNGYIDFPSDERLWDEKKRFPIGSSTRRQWEEQLRRLEPTIQEAITNIEQQRKEKIFDQSLSDVAAVTLQAMQDLNYSSMLPFGIKVEKPRKTKEGKTPKPEPLQTIQAQVENEYGRGLQGIIVELWRGNQRLEQMETGKSGKLSFGKRMAGKYRLRAVIPKSFPNYEIHPPSTVEFEILSGQGFKVTFTVTTHEPPKTESRMPRLEILLIDDPKIFPDPDNPYSIEGIPTLGLIYINASDKALGEASAGNDVEDWRSIIARYTAGAMAEHICGPQSNIHEVMICFNALFERERQLLGALGKKTSKARKSK